MTDSEEELHIADTSSSDSATGKQSNEGNFDKLSNDICKADLDPGEASVSNDSALNDSQLENSDGENSDSSSGSEGGELCAICLGRMRGEIGSPDTSECDHVFCLLCILEWAKTNATCPQDRRPFETVLVRSCLGGEVTNSIPVESQKDDANVVLVEGDENPTVCEICDSSDHEDRLLLCDGCDLGYHLYCLTPPLLEVPIEEWFCPMCVAVDLPKTLQKSKASRARERPPTQQRRRRNRSQRPVERRTRMIPRTRATERILARIFCKRQTTRNIDNSEEVIQAFRAPRPFGYLDHDDIDAAFNKDELAEKLLESEVVPSTSKKERKATAIKVLQESSSVPSSSYSGRSTVADKIQLDRQVSSDILGDILGDQSILLSKGKDISITEDRKLAKVNSTEEISLNISLENRIMEKPLPSKCLKENSNHEASSSHAKDRRKSRSRSPARKKSRSPTKKSSRKNSTSPQRDYYHRVDYHSSFKRYSPSSERKKDYYYNNFSPRNREQRNSDHNRSRSRRSRSRSKERTQTHNKHLFASKSHYTPKHEPKQTRYDSRSRYNSKESTNHPKNRFDSKSDSKGSNRHSSREQSRSHHSSKDHSRHKYSSKNESKSKYESKLQPESVESSKSQKGISEYASSSTYTGSTTPESPKKKVNSVDEVCFVSSFESPSEVDAPSIKAQNDIADEEIVKRNDAIEKIEKESLNSSLENESPSKTSPTKITLEITEMMKFAMQSSTKHPKPHPGKDRRSVADLSAEESSSDTESSSGKRTLNEKIEIRSNICSNNEEEMDIPNEFINFLSGGSAIKQDESTLRKSLKKKMVSLFGEDSDGESEAKRICKNEDIEKLSVSESFPEDEKVSTSKSSPKKEKASLSKSSPKNEEVSPSKSSLKNEKVSPSKITQENEKVSPRKHSLKNEIVSTSEISPKNESTLADKSPLAQLESIGSKEKDRLVMKSPQECTSAQGKPDESSGRIRANSKQLLEAKVVEEAKRFLDPYYQEKSLSKDIYKEIISKCVNKVLGAEAGLVVEIRKIQRLVDGYAKVYQHRAKRSTN